MGNRSKGVIFHGYEARTVYWHDREYKYPVYMLSPFCVTLSHTRRCARTVTIIYSCTSTAPDMSVEQENAIDIHSSTKRQS